MDLLSLTFVLTPPTNGCVFFPSSDQEHLKISDSPINKYLRHIGELKTKNYIFSPQRHLGGLHETLGTRQCRVPTYLKQQRTGRRGKNLFVLFVSLW